MMIKNNIVIIAFCLISFCFSSCNRSATDGYGEMTFLKSGNVSNLRGHIGFQQVVLAWDNPEDNSFIKNQVIYRTKSGLFGTIVTEKLVDSIVVEHLYSDEEYNFEIYTMNASGDYSEPSEVKLKPILDTPTLDNLTIPTCVLKFIPNDNGYPGEGKHQICWSGLSDDKMFFAGEITYSLRAGGFYTGNTNKIVFEIQNLNNINVLEKITTYKIDVLNLPDGEEYIINYSVNIWPISTGQHIYSSSEVQKIEGVLEGIVTY